MVASLVITFNYIYSSPGLGECGWRNIDPDFFLSVGALRWLENLRSGVVVDPGYTYIQLLGWFYHIQRNIGDHALPTFGELAGLLNPISDLSSYIVIGWRFNFLVISALAIMMFKLAKQLSGSTMVGFLAFALTLLTRSSINFLWVMRPDALSALFGIGSLFCVLGALRSGKLGEFAGYGVAGGTLLWLGLLTKLNLIPLLFIIPLASLTKLDTWLDTQGEHELRSLLRDSLILNVWLAPFTLFILKDYLQTLATSAYSALFALSLTSYLLALALLRSYLLGKLTINSDGVGRAIMQATICVAGFLLGFQISGGFSQIHPNPNPTLFAGLFLSAGGGILSVWIVRRTDVLQARKFLGRS